MGMGPAPVVGCHSNDDLPFVDWDGLITCLCHVIIENAEDLWFRAVFYANIEKLIIVCMET